MSAAKINGIVVVDKPPDWTSHDVVAKFRGMAKTKSVGHLGTLDPIATGVLPLIVGNVTRLARFYTKADKTYEAVVRFGFSTDTYDRSGRPTSELASAPSLPEIEAVLRGMPGPQLQMPPQYSAKKVGGRAAYESARRNIAVELTPVEIEIFELRVEGYSAPDLRVTVRSSGGTYVRSIAHDVGAALGCGAHLQELRRLSSGDFRIEQARTLEELQALTADGRLSEALLPASELLPDFPPVWVDAITAGEIRQGRDFHVSPFRERRDSQFVKAIEGNNTLLAVGEATMPNVYHPIVVLVN
jgi:tRNA pseudouridine55 synthase